MTYPFQDKVREFNEAAGDVLPSGPTLPDEATRVLRCKLLLEEAMEFIHASGCAVAITGTLGGTFTGGVVVPTHEPDLNAMVHENTDGLYVAFGNSLAMGIPAEAPFEAVHAANMQKVSGPTVHIINGKVMKPPGWKPADVGAVVERLKHRLAPPRSCDLHRDCDKADADSPAGEVWHK